jgi:hypothetical protein
MSWRAWFERLEKRAPATATEAVNREHFDAKAAEYDQEFGLSVELARGRARFIKEHSRRPLGGGHALELEGRR